MSRTGAIGAIIRKDLTLFLRDRFFVLITLLGLVAYIAIFWFLPDSVDETVTIGVHGEGFPAVSMETGAEGLEVLTYATTEELRTAVEEAEDGVVAGLDFPDDFASRVVAGETVTVTQYVRSDVPAEVETAMGGLAREIVAMLAGDPPPFSLLAEDVVVLGEDRAGDQVSLQERMRPLLAVFVLTMEALALASLVASEIEQRTVKAVLITPASATDFLAAKGLFGTGLAFFEVTLLLLLIGAFSTGAGPLLVTVLLGSILVTGVAMMAGSLGKDFIGIVFWSILFMIPLMVPGFAVLFPGSAGTWVKALPSYGLARSVVDVTTYGAGFGDILPLLAGLAAWCGVLFTAGVIILRRKVQTL